MQLEAVLPYNIYFTQHSTLFVLVYDKLIL